jgi:hypothetical protein
MNRVLLAILLLVPQLAAATVNANGRHWRIGIESLQCDAAGSLAIGTRIDYTGPKGAVEAPVHELVDGAGTQIRPKSLVWKGGDKQVVRWLPVGGIAQVKADHVATLEFKFDVKAAKGDLRFAFGDIQAIALTKSGALGACERLLKLAELQAPRFLSRAVQEEPKLRVYREAHPCLTPQKTLRTVESNQPKYLPVQMLLFGRGFLPAARQVDLPEGKVPAQSYAYTGADELVPVENAARRAIAADFPAYRSDLVMSGDPTPRKLYAFNWGDQKSATGQKLYPVGIYEVRACAR